MKNKISIPWTFNTSKSYRVIGSAMALTTVLIPILMNNPRKFSLSDEMVFEIFLVPLALFFLNLTFIKVQCSSEDMKNSYLLFHGKSISWKEIKKIELLSGYRGGYSIWIFTTDKKVSVAVQMYPKEDILAFVDLLKEKVSKSNIDIDLNKIEGSYF